MNNNYTSIISAAYRLVHNNSVEKLASVVGKSPNSLRNEVNPNLTGPKLGVIDAVALTNHSNDFSLLQAFCLACGHIAIPISSDAVYTDSNVLRDWAIWQAESGKTADEIKEALEDGKISPRELADIHAQGMSKTSAFLSLLQTLAAQSHMQVAEVARG